MPSKQRILRKLGQAETNVDGPVPLEVLLELLPTNHPLSDAQPINIGGTNYQSQTTHSMTNPRVRFIGAPPIAPVNNLEALVGNAPLMAGLATAHPTAAQITAVRDYFRSLYHAISAFTSNNLANAHLRALTNTAFFGGAYLLTEDYLNGLIGTPDAVRGPPVTGGVLTPYSVHSVNLVAPSSLILRGPAGNVNITNMEELSRISFADANVEGRRADYVLAYHEMLSELSRTEWYDNVPLLVAAGTAALLLAGGLVYGITQFRPAAAPPVADTRTPTVTFNTPTTGPTATTAVPPAAATLIAGPTQTAGAVSPSPQRSPIPQPSPTAPATIPAPGPAPSTPTGIAPPAATPSVVIVPPIPGTSTPYVITVTATSTSTPTGATATPTQLSVFATATSAAAAAQTAIAYLTATPTAPGATPTHIVIVTPSGTAIPYTPTGTPTPFPINPFYTPTAAATPQDLAAVLRQLEESMTKPARFGFDYATLRTMFYDDKNGFMEAFPVNGVNNVDEMAKLFDGDCRNGEFKDYHADPAKVLAEGGTLRVDKSARTLLGYSVADCSGRYAPTRRTDNFGIVQQNIVKEFVKSYQKRHLERQVPIR